MTQRTQSQALKVTVWLVAGGAFILWTLLMLLAAWLLGLGADVGTWATAPTVSAANEAMQAAGSGVAVNEGVVTGTVTGGIGLLESIGKWVIAGLWAIGSLGILLGAVLLPKAGGFISRMLQKR
jgi:hypothetical protein